MRFFPAFRVGSPSTTIQTSGTFGLTANPPKNWCKEGSELTSNIFGTCLLQTRRIRYRKLIARLTRKRIPERDECTPAGLTLHPGHSCPKILRSFRKES